MGANAQTSVPLFVANSVLTAAQQNISAATGVPVFATTVTRDAAFGGSNKALAEGQLAYIEASNVVQYYDGAAWATVGPSTVQEASFAEYQASGTAGGTSVAGSFQKRILNTTLTNNITGCTLTSSVIALPAGTYTIVVNSSFLNPNPGYQIKLRNTTDSTNTIFGVVGYANTTGTSAQSTLAGSFTITGTKNFEIQYRLDTAKASDGLGVNLNFETNCYTTCLITKVA